MKKISPIIRYAFSALLACAGFIFIYRFIDPSLIDFKQQPLFLHSDFFAKPFLDYPGGVTEYLSLFVSQYFVNRFSGSVLLVVLAGLVVLLSYLLLKKQLSKMAAWAFSLLPGIVLICLHANYQVDVQTDLVLFIALLTALIFRFIQFTKIYIKAPVVVILAVVLYFLFGGTALLLFSLLTIAEILISKNKKDFILIGLLIITALVLPFYTSATSAYLNFNNAIIGIIELKNKPIFHLQLATLILIPLVIILSPLEEIIAKKIKISQAVKTIIHISIAVLLLLGAVGGFAISFNQQKKNTLLIHLNAKNENWKEVLTVGAKLPLSDRKVVYQLNRALYHQNRLADQAFAIPQFWGEHGLILTTHFNSEVLMDCSDIFFDMGHVKGALHWAYEAQTKFPNSPDVLKRIVLCNLIIGEYITATKFIDILSHSTIHKKWAEKYRNFLNNDRLISEDSYLSGKRKLIPLEDFYSNTQHPQYDLSMLLKQHPENKMAFEYFMFDALLNHDLAKVATNLFYLEKLGYQKIPVHIEEGLLLFRTFNKDYPIDLGKYTISKETKERFSAYSKLLLKYKQNKKEGQPLFEKEFGNTFWYYIQFVSPITTKRVFQEK